MRRTMRFLIDNVELVLSALGVLVIILVPLIFVPIEAIWVGVAVTAIVVGVLHGGIFWLIRRKQRLAREQTIREIRTMLNDVVRNELNVIALNSQFRVLNPERMARVERSIDRISEALTMLSDESFKAWSTRYTTDEFKPVKLDSSSTQKTAQR